MGSSSFSRAASASTRSLPRARPVAVVISRPRKMLSTTDRLGHRLSSWWTMATPWATASVVEAKAMGSPSSSMVPEVGGWTPERIFMRVDLPAPFSPMRATTSPARISKSTPRRAWVAPKALVMLWPARTTGAFSLRVMTPPRCSRG